MRIRLATSEDVEKVAKLISQFRVELKALKGIQSPPKEDQAKEEFNEYLDANYLIYIAEDHDEELLGYLVCRVDQGVVWAESIYVNQGSRRKGVASELYKEAEKLAADLGHETVYNWVHPNNDKIIKFLAKMNYNVLNLIEIRKAYENERLTQTLRVGNHDYHY